jgi:hypothetical protein
VPRGASRLRAAAAPAAIFVVAAGLRLVGIGDRLSDAEGYSWLVAAAGDWRSFLHHLAAYENTPPLFYLLLRPLPLDDEPWLRLPALVPGVLAVVVVLALAARLFGRRAGLLAALALAVAPYAVSYADYARAFMLADLGLLIAIGAGIVLATGGGQWWWLAYTAGGALALWSEYDAALALGALAVALVVLVRGPRARTAALCAVPALTLAPWAHQLHRSLDALDHTKTSPVFPGPGPGSLRDLAVALTAGEHGRAHSGALRWAQVVVIGVVLGAAAALAWRATAPSSAARRGLGVLLTVGVGTLVAHAVTAAVGPDIFNQRYLTVLIPLGAIVLGAGVAALPWRHAGAWGAVALLAVGAAVAVQRAGRELEPDLAPVRAAVAARHPARVATNSAVVAFYLRDLHPVLDRPFGLAPGGIPECAEGCVVVDDARVPGGPRPGPDGRAFGPIVVR